MEILDLYDDKGNLLGKTIERGNKNFGLNEFIKLCVVWIKCGNKYLIQKCSKQKGGEYAVTGGHVPTGKSSLEQAEIETFEELGLKIDIKNLKFLGQIKISHALFDVYLFENGNLEKYNFVLQKEEVEEIKFLTKQELENLIKNNLVRKSTQMHYEKFIKYDN